MRENRKHQRIDSRLRCWCEGENVTVYARVGNLSEGGLFVRTSTPLREGSRALLRFRDGDSVEVSAEAKVVWTSGGSDHTPAGMGLQFEALDEHALAKIRSLLRTESRATEANHGVG